MTTTDMVNGIEQAKIVQEIVVAYDRFAESAMREIVNATGIDDDAAPKIAEHAWLLADAMMAERAKRGLGMIPSGLFPNPSGEPKP